MPFFSVLMPTRNRASLLKSSLDSAIRQNFQDYEIIVSDNNSTDETRSVVESFMRSSDKVKYVNPGRDLSMCDNWEYVLSPATGRYLLYLCDDDALCPESLSCIHKVLTRYDAPILVWRPANYYHPDIPRADMRCTLSYYPGSGQIFEVASSPMMDALCKFDVSVYGLVPKMLNCAVAREALERCAERTGMFFVPPFPDFACVGQLLSTHSTYHFFDSPLYVSGASVVSNAGIFYNRKEKGNLYLSLFGGNLLEGVTYPMRHLATPYFQATWRFFQKTYPETFTSRVDMEAYLKSLFSELTRFVDYEDVSEEFAQIADYMRDYSGGDEMFDRLWREHERERAARLPQNGPPSGLGRLKRGVKSVLSKNERLFELVQRARGVHPAHDPTVLQEGVGSIVEASKILDGFVATRCRALGEERRPVPVASADFLKPYRSEKVSGA